MESKSLTGKAKADLILEMLNMTEEQETQTPIGSGDSYVISKRRVSTFSGQQREELKNQLLELLGIS